MMSEEIDTSGSSGGVQSSSDNFNMDSSVEGSSSSVTNGGASSLGESKKTDSGIQLEPSKEEMERERLSARAEQLQDDIVRIHNELVEKEAELAEIKSQLGITAYTEFKDSMSQSFKVVGSKWKEVQETDTFRKIDSTLSGWKQKVEGSGSYQKTVSSLNEGGKKVSEGLSSAGTKIKDSETLKSVGEKTTSAFKRTGTVISGAASSLKGKVWVSTDAGDGDPTPGGDTPTKKETVIPDEPTKE